MVTRRTRRGGLSDKTEGVTKELSSWHGHFTQKYQPFGDQRSIDALRTRRTTQHLVTYLKT